MPSSVDTDSILARIKSLYGIHNDKDIAGLLNLSPQDFSNRKKRGTLIDPIVRWGINENVDLSWVLSGKRAASESNQAILDPALLKQIIAGVESYLEDIRKTLTPDLKARLVALLYDHYAETGENVDRRKIVSYLKLVG